jgi:cell division septation protein DedD
MGAVEEEDVMAKAKPEIREDYASDTALDNVSDIGEPNQDYTYSEDQDDFKTGFSMKGHRRRPKKSGLLIPLIVIAVLVAVAAAGFLLYQHYLSPAEVKAPLPVQAPKVVQPQDAVVLSSQEQQQQEQPVAQEGPGKTIEAPPKEAPPKEAPVSKPVVKPASKHIANPVYSVQLGAFKNEGSAEALAIKFKGKGYEAFKYTDTTKDKGNLHRVLIGKFANRKEALKLASQIHTKEKVNTTVFSGEVK